MRNQQSSSVLLNDLPEGIEIHINAKRNFVLVVFFACWIAGWAVGEFSVIEILLKPPFNLSKLPLIIWLAGWSLVGLTVILIWLWTVNGKEIIRIDENNLTHIRIFTVFSRSHRIHISNIDKLTVSTKNTSMFKLNSGIRYWGLSGGIIEFDCKDYSYRFGSNLNKQQAESIIEQIRARFSTI